MNRRAFLMSIAGAIVAPVAIKPIPDRAVQLGTWPFEADVYDEFAWSSWDGLYGMTMEAVNQYGDVVYSGPLMDAS